MQGDVDTSSRARGTSAVRLLALIVLAGVIALQAVSTPVNATTKRVVASSPP